jgi:hypothetical protein
LKKDAPYIIVAIGSMITANARLELTRKLLYLYSKGYEVYYCDTDSIYTNAPPNEFSISNKLGDWKLEHDIYYGEFVLPKTYFFVDQCGFDFIKSKGLRLKTKAEFDRYISGELVEQEDIVKISPFKKAVKQCGTIVGYKPTSKKSNHPEPKRLTDGPLHIEESMPEWLNDLITKT